MKQFLKENSYRKRRFIAYNHVTEVLISSAKTYGDGPFRKIRVYLIYRDFSQFAKIAKILCSQNIHGLQYVLSASCVMSVD